MWIFLILALVAAARADEACEACVESRCHSRRPLLQGFHVSDQLAIDRANNILYTQLNGDTTIAFFLDQPRILTVQVANSTGLAVDQETSLLYSSRNGIIYAHPLNEDGYYAQPMYFQAKPTTPAKLRYEDTLYTINKDGSCGYFSKTSYLFAGYENLQNFVVTDMANVKGVTNWFFVSNNKLFRYVISDTGEESWLLISNKKHVLSIGGKGDNYFGDDSEKTIYKLDRQTMELKEYAFYESGSVKDFVFDKDENIVSIDAEGRVAQWVQGTERCQMRPRAKTYPVVEMEDMDLLIRALLRKDVTSSDDPKPPEVNTEDVPETNSETKNTDETMGAIGETVNWGSLEDWVNHEPERFFDEETDYSYAISPMVNAKIEGPQGFIEDIDTEQPEE